jgi:hypothetical protein
MTTIEVPEAELVSLTLLPEHRETLGPAEDVRAQPDRVSMGRPVCVPLEAATVDDDAKVFLGDNPGSACFLLALTASFTPDDENPLVWAWVDVTMSTSEPTGTPEPVAWSMKPLSAADPVSVSRKVSFETGGGIGGAGRCEHSGPRSSCARLKIFKYSAALEHLPDVARVTFPRG